MVRALALAAMLLAPVAAAQAGGAGTFTNPVQGAYSDVYVVAGRAVDADGRPVARGVVHVKLDAPGVAAPGLDAGTDCFGVFIASFELRRVDPRGTITATVGGRSQSQPVDPFFRRSDLNLTLPGAWTGGGCPDQTPLWGQRVGVAGRILNRTDPYAAQGETYHARPPAGHVRLTYRIGDARSECPPSGRGEGLCDPVPIDERGDFRYSWVFAEAQDATGRIDVAYENRTWSFAPDPTFRYALAMIEVSGLGAPLPVAAPTPGPPLALALALALVGASLLPGTRARR